MINNNSILTEIKGSTATIWLNRPEKHNALNIEMISGLLIAIQFLNNSENIRIIILRARGKSFCAGADLNWMQQSSLLSPEDNYSECEALAKCFYELYNSPKISICVVHGASIGGANGLVAASDISVAGHEAVFAFSEARVGLLPATIAPYIIQKTGRSKALELLITGRKFSAGEAVKWGLVSEAVSHESIEKHLDGLLSDVYKGSPLVQSFIKTRLLQIGELTSGQSVIKETASLLAQTRIGPDAKEGINAFMQKRKPSWDNI